MPGDPGEQRAAGLPQGTRRQHGYEKKAAAGVAVALLFRHYKFPLLLAGDFNLREIDSIARRILDREECVVPA